MQTDPALPWTPADGGRIILEEPITQQEILAGALDIIVRGGTPEADQHLQIVQGSGVYDLQLDGDTLWNIEKITGQQTELTVNSTSTGVEGYNIVSIERLGYIDGLSLQGVYFVEEGDYAYLSGTLSNGSNIKQCLFTFDGIHAIRGLGDISLVITNSDEIYEGSVFGEASIPQQLQTLDLIKVKTIVMEGKLMLRPLFVPNGVGDITLTDTQGNEINPGYSGDISIPEI